ncbi:M20/M25/M40 family metallo-hydrolase [Lutispora sp.]|uniref:M20/M25/M40 family metallo-hydrolase n=1 Tax=Lutispora sp. TaxID=2828727 RepID=UPI00356A3EFE
MDWMKIEELLQRLIRFDTTNPPGNEGKCIMFIHQLLEEAGIESMILGEKEDRLNLFARLRGKGTKPPFLMYGHVDVVTTAHQSWDYSPFEGMIEEGCIWGRGALDMKGAVAMMIWAMVHMKHEGIVPSGDIVLCLVCDEEDAGLYGAKYVVEGYRELFKDIRYAIGEIGGFTMHINGKRFYPIMVAEKQRCGIRAVIKGQGGHGSMPAKAGAMAKLGRILTKLDKSRLPVHITPPGKMMFEALASNLSFPTSKIIKSLLNPRFTDRVLDIMGDKGRVFDPLLHNTVNATIVRGGEKINVIPGEVVLDFDGRILPGFSSESILIELENILGKDADLELLFYDKGPDKVDMTMFEDLGAILKEGDNDAIPIPFVVSGVTDARFFSRLGIQTYGFTPMMLPDDIDFSKLIHNANERIPVEALYFGSESIFKLISRY